MGKKILQALRKGQPHKKKVKNVCPKNTTAHKGEDKWLTEEDDSYTLKIVTIYEAAPVSQFRVYCPKLQEN